MAVGGGTGRSRNESPTALRSPRTPRGVRDFASVEAINEAVTDSARPRAVIIISSYLPELFGVCDRIAVMSQGKLTRAVPVADLTPHDVMLVATGKAADLPQINSSPRS